MLFIVLMVLMVVALGGGGWGLPRFGYASWSPLGPIVVVAFVFWLTGSLQG